MSNSTRSRIEALLVEEGLEPGDRVPAERSLAHRLEQSRSAVRKVLDEFEAEGRVERHVGRGTFLIRTATDGSESMSPRDVMAVRRLLEPAVARRIVAEATPADVAEIGRCMQRCEEAESYREFEYWDGAAHQAMIEAAHSPLLSRMYLLVDQARSGSLWGRPQATLRQPRIAAELHRGSSDHPAGHRQPRPRRCRARHADPRRERDQAPLRIAPPDGAPTSAGDSGTPQPAVEPVQTARGSRFSLSTNGRVSTVASCSVPSRSPSRTVSPSQSSSGKGPSKRT